MLFFKVKFFKGAGAGSRCSRKGVNNLHVGHRSINSTGDREEEGLSRKGRTGIAQDNERYDRRRGGRPPSWPSIALTVHDCPSAAWGSRERENEEEEGWCYRFNYFSDLSSY